MILKPSFFGSKELPVLDLSPDAIRSLAQKNISQGLTVTGVQKKLSLALSRENGGRLTLIDYPAGYILKPQTEEYPFLPEAEDAVMDIAEACGISVVPHGLLALEDEYGYITKRIDRVTTPDGSFQKRAMEDLCQLSGRLTEDKYKGSYEKCAELIRAYSSRPGIDLTEFFLRLVVSFVTGNSDMHLKNFSLIETAPGSRIFVLSPAYDLLPVNLVSDDPEETALTLNGKKKNLKKKDLMILAQRCGIPDKAAERMIAKVLKTLPKAEEICRFSMLPKDRQESLCDLMRERAEILQADR